MPNNREWAMLIWLGALVAYGLSRREIRSGASLVLRSGAAHKIAIPFIAMGLWVGLEIYLAASARLWSTDLLTGTVIWFVSNALVLFVNTPKASKRPWLLVRAALYTLSPLVLIQAWINLSPMPLLAEIAIQPLVFLLVAFAVVAGLEDRFAPVSKLANGILGAIGTALLIYALYATVTGWARMDISGVVLQMALPVWLTLGLTPYLYAVAAYAAYETAFVLVDFWARNNPSPKWPRKLALLISFGPSLHALSAFNGPWLSRLAETTSFRGACEVIRQSQMKEDAASDAEPTGRGLTEDRAS
jgi:hypothetical protein